MRFNERETWELVLDTSDVSFLGSGNVVAKMPEVVSRLQLVANTSLLEYVSFFEGCMQSPNCSETLTASNADIFNSHYQHIFDQLPPTASVSEWQTANMEIERIYKISQGSLTSMEFYYLVKGYYLDVLGAKVARLNEKKQT